MIDAEMQAPRVFSQRLFEIVKMSARRQLKVRYRGSLLGVFWSFGNPVLTTALYTILFGSAFAPYFGGSTSRYVFSAFIGVVVVTFFLQGTTEALLSVVSNGGLLNKIAIDGETFPIAAVASNTFQQSITTFPIIILLAAVITHDPLRVILAPVVLAALVALVAGFGLALSALFVFFRDLANLWGVIGFVLWMTSPVFYPPALVPERVRPWVEINPLGLSISALRDVATGHGPINLALIGTSVAVSLAVLLAGHLIFRATRLQFMDLL